MITEEEFLEAKKFIYSDIEREIKLARFWENPFLRRLGKLLGLPHGGGNFLATLGLLCYTEFGGKLKYNVVNAQGRAVASANFNQFFDDLGSNYRNFRASFTDSNFVYDTFRCGLAHEYFIKKSSTIYMLDNPNSNKIGLGVEGTNEYYFVVEKYLSDLKVALEDLQQLLYP